MEVITIESKAYSEIMKRLEAKGSEVVTIESKAFREILNRLEPKNRDESTDSQAFREIIKRLDRIALYMRDISADEDWVDDTVVRDYLKVSIRTLQRLRSAGFVNYTLFGRKAMYKIGEVRRLLNENLIKSNPQNFEELLNNYRKDVR